MIYLCLFVGGYEIYVHIRVYRLAFTTNWLTYSIIKERSILPYLFILIKSKILIFAFYSVN